MNPSGHPQAALPNKRAVVHEPVHSDPYVSSDYFDVHDVNVVHDGDTGQNTLNNADYPSADMSSAYLAHGYHQPNGTQLAALEQHINTLDQKVEELTQERDQLLAEKSQWIMTMQDENSLLVTVLQDARR